MNCPLPISRYDTITLAHGGGGTLTAGLLHEIFLPAFGPPTPAPHDASAFAIGPQQLAITTDSYVVQPLFFPGGNIGSLAVNGTVNDLLMAGARPRALTASFILEEGLPLATLRAVVDTMQQAAQAAGVRIIAGDTKVIHRANGDGLYITTTGVGDIVTPAPLAPSACAPSRATPPASRNISQRIPPDTAADHPILHAFFMPPLCRPSFPKETLFPPPPLRYAPGA